ncbi:hypothetical protein NST28_22710 [Paenibacillus sp. FSL R10-2791]|uniref:hypothetical protein n=1 Tax=Paenibacillus sp. FSL R10-2791 TaxID=2954695 RepID=UPI0030FA3644
MPSAAEITRNIVVATVQNSEFFKVAVSGKSRGELVQPTIETIVDLYNSVFETVSKSLS